MKLTLKAYAKLNLLLDITGILDNGYHSLNMIMQSVDLYDTVTVEELEDIGVIITSSDSNIPTDSRNTMWKAVIAFEKATNKKCGVKIHIDKKIPSPAGLAGGSADAAAVLYALNIIYGTNLSPLQLCSIGATVGADVPFCIVGGTKLALNIGDVLSPLPDIGDCHIVIAVPDTPVYTKEAYSAFDNSKDSITHPDNIALIAAAASGNYEKVYKNTSNVFEQIIEVPDRVPIKAVMRKNNCELTLMSGSGPSVFGIFKNAADALRCANELLPIIEKVHVCKPVDKGIEIIEQQ